MKFLSIQNGTGETEPMQGVQSEQYPSSSTELDEAIRHREDLLDQNLARLDGVNSAKPAMSIPEQFDRALAQTDLRDEAEKIVLLHEQRSSNKKVI